VVDIASDGKIVAAGFKNNGIPIARYITDPQGQGSSYQILLPLVVQ
jgi:hypothetical protein